MNSFFREIWIIAKYELAKIINNKMFWPLNVIWVIIMTFIPMKIIGNLTANTGGTNEKLNILKMFIDIYTANYSFTIILLLAVNLMPRIFIQEKADKSIHALLTTPVNLKSIWIGKTLSVFFSGYGLSLFTTMFFVTVYNFYFSGAVILPSFSALLMLIIVNPLTAFLLLMFLGLIQLIYKEKGLVNLLLFLIAYVLLAKSGVKVMNIKNTWFYISDFVIADGLLLLANFAMSYKLNRERIILS